MLSNTSIIAALLSQNNTLPQCAYRIEITNLRFGLLCAATIIAIFGIIFNLMLAYVFVKSNKICEPNSALLAILDFLMCLCYILVFGTAEAFAYYLEIEFIYKALFAYIKYGFVLSKIVQFCIPALLILTLLHRWAYLTHRRVGFWRPLHIRSVRATIGLCLVLVSFLSRIPFMWSLEIHTFLNCTDLLRTREIWSTDEADTDWYKVYDHCILWTQVLIPFALLLALNTAIVFKLRSKRRESQRKMNEFSRGRRQRRNAATRLLQDCLVFKLSSAIQHDVKEYRRFENNAISTMAIIVSTYLTCNLFHVLLTIVEKWLASDLLYADAWSNAYVISIDCINFLFMFASMIRLCVYYKFNPLIRQELKPLLFLHGFRRKKETYRSFVGLQMLDMDGLLKSTVGMGLKIDKPHRKYATVLATDDED